MADRKISELEPIEKYKSINDYCNSVEESIKNTHRPTSYGIADLFQMIRILEKRIEYLESK